MRKKSLAYLVTIVSCCLVAIACSSDSDGGNGAVIGPETGKTGILSLSLTDVPTDLYQAVYIRIDGIQVYLGGGEEIAGNWKTVATPLKIYNLLELVNGVLEQLGTSSLGTGTYQRMRLVLGTAPTNSANILGVSHPYANYVIDPDNRTHELNIPSTIIAGSKIAGDFKINENSTTELILDFDVPASVVQAGNSGNWLLTPKINVLNADEYATVSGIVNKLADSESSGIPGAHISLQYETPGADDLKDAVTVETATVSAEGDMNNSIENGDYALLTDPGSYRLVSYKDGYAVGCTAVDSITGQITIQDVELTTAAAGTVEGNVIINGADSEQYATLSFRQPATCEGMTATSMLEVRSVNIVAGYWYQISLPVGTYSLVASGTDMETVEYTGIKVTDSGVSYQNVSLAP